MKNLFYVFLVFFGTVLFSYAEGIAEEAAKGKEKADLSYAFGMLVADDLKETGLDFNYDTFIGGFRDMMENGNTRFTMQEAMEIIETAFIAQQTELGARNLAEGLAFLTENGQRQGVETRPSGLQIELVSEGDGEIPGPADIVLVHYEGSLIDGTIFDSSLIRGEALEIPLDRVIPGWSEGLRLMREGSKAMLYIPPDLAYGENGAGIIGPNSVLIFSVELITILREQDESTTPP